METLSTAGKADLKGENNNGVMILDYDKNEKLAEKVNGSRQICPHLCLIYLREFMTSHKVIKKSVQTRNTKVATWMRTSQ